MAHSKSLKLSSMCRICRQTYAKQSRRTLSGSPASREAERRPTRLSERFGMRVNEGRSTQEPADPMSAWQDSLDKPVNSRASTRSVFQTDLNPIARTYGEATPQTSQRSTYVNERYHLNVYAHRHNTHITFTEPSRNPIISYSCGNLGLRNAQKASYDASFQLCAYTFRKMAEKQWKLGGSKANSNTSPWQTLANIKKPQYSNAGGDAPGIEVILRGFGPGREAFQKALLGTEGRIIKPLIAKVTDGTRLKFGGTRSPQVRRLG